MYVMYVCIYVMYVCMYVFVCMYVYVCNVCMCVCMYVCVSRSLDKPVIIFVMTISTNLLQSTTKQHILYEQRLKQGSNQSTRLWSCGFWNKVKRYIEIFQAVATERVSPVKNKKAHIQRPLSY